jgi:hypothetical protein
MLGSHDDTFVRTDEDVIVPLKGRGNRFICSITKVYRTVSNYSLVNIVLQDVRISDVHRGRAMDQNDTVGEDERERGE